MTSFNTAAAESAIAAELNAQKRMTSFTGERNKNLAVSEIAGVVGGVLGGVCALSNGASKTAAIGGAVCGAIGGYAMGSLLSPFSDINTTTKVLTGLTAGSFGISVAGLGASIVGALCNLGDGSVANQ